MPLIFRPLIAAFLILIVAPTLTAAETSAGDDARKAEVARLIDQWAEARVKGDTVFLEQFYDADLRLNQMNGGVVARNDDIALFAARLIRPEYIRDTDVHIGVFGDTAVVSCIESLKGTYRGIPGEMSLRMLNILVHHDGRWQLVASQSTPISQAGK